MAAANPGTTTPKSTVRQRKKPSVAATQRYLPIAEIRNDCVILKNGGIRGILGIGSMNFSLKSEPEQEAIILSYQQFLNTLAFPIQIVIRSTKMNVDAYVGDLRDRAGKQENPLLREQTLDYATFIERLVDVSDIMQKHFYVVIPMDAPGQTKVSFLSKYMSWLSPGDTKAKAAMRKRQFDEMSQTLGDRVNLVKVGLESLGLTAERLSTSQLIELYYQIYNPMTSQNQKLTDLGALHLAQGVL